MGKNGRRHSLGRGYSETDRGRPDEIVSSLCNVRFGSKAVIRSIRQPSSAGVSGPQHQNEEATDFVTFAMVRFAPIEAIAKEPGRTHRSALYFDERKLSAAHHGSYSAFPHS